MNRKQWVVLGFGLAVVGIIMTSYGTDCVDILEVAEDVQSSMVVSEPFLACHRDKAPHRALGMALGGVGAVLCFVGAFETKK